MKNAFVLAITSFLFAAAALGEEAAATNAPPKPPPWDASATLGLTLTRGNSRTTMVAGNVQAARKWDKNELDLGLDGVYGEDNGVNNAESVHGFGQYNRLFTERVYGFFRADGLYDGIANIDYRFTISAGAGYYLIKTTNLFLRAEVGPGYVFEKVGGTTHEYATIRFAERLEWKITEHSKFYESVEYLPQVTKFQNYVINAEMGIDTPISKKVTQSTFLLDTYRSEPAPGRLHNDFKLIFGLKYKL